MNDFIDTNLVLRYLTGEPKDQHLRARALIESGATLVVTEVVLLETAFTLRTRYGLSREQIVDSVIDFVMSKNIMVHHLEREVVIEALRLCRPSNRVSFGDAMIWASARCAQPARLFSFDERFPTGEVEIRRP